GVGVAGHLQVAAAGGGAAHDDGALPVADGGVELLVFEGGDDAEVEAFGGEAEAPAGGVGTAARARPRAFGGSGEVVGGEAKDRAVGADEGGFRERVGRAVGAVEAVEHEV